MFSRRIVNSILVLSQLTNSFAANNNKQLRSAEHKKDNTRELQTHFSFATTNTTENVNDFEQNNQTTCVLKAVLGYPFDDPDDAPFKGYHSDWLMIQRGNGSEWEDWCWGGNATDWCLYENTGNSTGAYIGNIDDVYYPDEAAIYDELYTEIFTLHNMSDTSLTMVVENEHFAQDYYSNYDDWDDHMLAATLTITKDTNETVGEPNGYSYDVFRDVPTHINGLQNPDYHGKFSLSVVCDSSCQCTASNFTIL